mgnify:CR=1 FL=1
MKLPRPEPSAGVLAYATEREDCLSLDPLKRENFKTYLKDRKALTGFLPIKLDIENCSRCNFACTMCAVSKWAHGKRAKDMTLEEFKHLIDEQYGLVEIKLNGLGEALMQGDDYFEMIKYARSKRIWVRMTTNGSLLHLRDNYKKLIDSGVNEIDISIDGANKKVFEGIRIQSDFDQVIENAKLLNTYCESLGIIRTKMWTLVQKGNYTDLVNHLHLAEYMRFRNVVFSLNMHGWADPELKVRNEAEMVTLSDDYLGHLLETAKNKGIRLSFWDVNDKFDTDKPENLCPWPFERSLVTSDSRTVPCCMIADPSKFEFGEGKKTFLQNWTGKEYEDFRRSHLEGRIPDVCKACYK